MYVGLNYIHKGIASLLFFPAQILHCRSNHMRTLQELNHTNWVCSDTSTATYQRGGFFHICIYTWRSHPGLPDDSFTISWIFINTHNLPQKKEKRKNISRQLILSVYHFQYTFVYAISSLRSRLTTPNYQKRSPSLTPKIFHTYLTNQTPQQYSVLVDQFGLTLATTIQS